MTGLIDPPGISGSTVMPDFGDEFNGAWDAFVRTTLAVALVRSREEREMISAWTARLASLQPSATNAWSTVVGEAREDPVQAIVLQQLAEEMWFYAWAFRSAHQTPAPPFQLPPRVGPLLTPVARDPQSDAAVDNADVVVGSIKSLIDKLPKVLQRFLDILMEVLKLTRGVAE